MFSIAFLFTIFFTKKRLIYTAIICYEKPEGENTLTLRNATMLTGCISYTLIYSFVGFIK